MIISLALLAPIIAVLYWIYSYTGKRGLGVGDYVMLTLIVIVVFAGTVITHLMVGNQNGSLWVYVLAPMVGYGLLLIGIGIAFWLRNNALKD